MRNDKTGSCSYPFQTFATRSLNRWSCLDFEVVLCDDIRFAPLVINHPPLSSKLLRESPLSFTEGALVPPSRGTRPEAHRVCLSRGLNFTPRSTRSKDTQFLRCYTLAGRVGHRRDKSMERYPARAKQSSRAQSDTAVCVVCEASSLCRVCINS